MKNTLCKLIFTFILIALFLGIFANAMTKQIGRDEHMYCTGGVLMAQGKMIYRDFSYVAQMPYHPLLYAVLYKIFDTSYYLFVSRITSVICNIMTVVCIVGIYRNILGKSSISHILPVLAGAVIYVFNPVVDYANGHAWNNDVVVMLTILSFWLFISTDFNRSSKYWRIVLIAVILTIATFMRMTIVFIQSAFLVALLFEPLKSRLLRVKIILMFLLASAIAALWPVYVILQAPRAFFLNSFWIQTLNSQWLHEIGFVFNKLHLLSEALTNPGYFVLVGFALVLWVLTILRHQKPHSNQYRHFILAMVLSLMFFVIALLLPITWKQHLAMPVPFIVVSLAWPIAYIHSTEKLKKHFCTTSILLFLCVLVTVISYPVVLFRIPKILDYHNWIPIRLHKVSQDIAVKAGKTDKVLTLSPLFALEGGCDIYTELSAGSFVYRIGDFLSPEDRAITHTVGPETLADLIETTPPSAVLLGTEIPFIEDGLYQTAVKPDWTRYEFKDFGLVLFSRP